MPRGKVFNQSLASNVFGDEATDNDTSSKQGSAKFTLILPDSETMAEPQDEHAQWAMEMEAQKVEAQSTNFKFTVLLVTLFVAVNIGLVALLDNDKPEELSSASLVKSDKVLKMPEEMAPVVKDNNTPAKLPLVDVAEPEKPELAKPAVAAEKPVLDKKQIAVKNVSEKAMQEKAVVPVKRVSARPAATGVFREDLLSIINKE